MARGRRARRPRCLQQRERRAASWCAEPEQILIRIHSARCRTLRSQSLARGEQKRGRLRGARCYRWGLSEAQQGWLRNERGCSSSPQPRSETMRALPCRRTLWACRINARDTPIRCRRPSRRCPTLFPIPSHHLCRQTSASRPPPELTRPDGHASGFSSASRISSRTYSRRLRPDRCTIASSMSRATVASCPSASNVKL